MGELRQKEKSLIENETYTVHLFQLKKGVNDTWKLMKIDIARNKRQLVRGGFLLGLPCFIAVNRNGTVLRDFFIYVTLCQISLVRISHKT